MSPVTTSVDDGVLVVRLDDGKMNAISHRVIEQLHGALDTAAVDAQAVCLVGNDRALSAGFDLSVMSAGPVAARELVEAGARLLMRLYAHPQPTVVAVTGHALAAGALVVLSCDTRIAADKSSKIGLNEVAIGMRVPVFAMELARDRLSKRYATRATLQAEIFDPAGAKAAGYIDGVVDEASCVQSAVDEARRLGRLPGGGYAASKQALRQATIEHVLATLDEDMSLLAGPANP
jgi:enoyl-CoA hydratase/carnithine racemase